MRRIGTYTYTLKERAYISSLTLPEPRAFKGYGDIVILCSELLLVASTLGDTVELVVLCEGSSYNVCVQR